MGTNNVSKQVSVRLLGEPRGDAGRTLLVLRAWALWRARQGGWADQQRGRSRHFKEQDALLERDIRDLGAPGKLLGHSKANSALRAWTPEIVDRLL